MSARICLKNMVRTFWSTFIPSYNLQIQLLTKVQAMYNGLLTISYSNVTKCHKMWVDLILETSNTYFEFFVSDSSQWIFVRIEGLHGGHGKIWMHCGKQWRVRKRRDLLECCTLVDSDVSNTFFNAFSWVFCMVIRCCSCFL